MTFLNTKIDSLSNISLQEQLRERIELVIHKIKFMDKLPVAILNMRNEINPLIDSILETAGAYPVHQNDAVYLIYLDNMQPLSKMIQDIPAVLNTNHPAFANHRIRICSIKPKLDIEDWVSLTEDIAEMLHIGCFVFGNEGHSWVRFEK